MTTIGDGFIIAFTLTGLFITSWVTSIAIMLLFPNVSERARVAATERTAKTVGLGLVLLLTIGLLGIVGLGNPLPILKLVGWVIILGLLAVAAVGTSGISQAAGYRLKELDPSISLSQAMLRGAAFVVGPTILPLLGWMFYAPLLLLASLGAGWKALRPLAVRKHSAGVA